MSFRELQFIQPLKQEWKYLGGSGHRYFRCSITKRVAIADNSGKYPDQTYDGILYVDADKLLGIADTLDPNDWHDSIPVQTPAGQNYNAPCCFVEWGFAVSLIRLEKDDT